MCFCEQVCQGTEEDGREERQGLREAESSLLLWASGDASGGLSEDTDHRECR